MKERLGVMTAGILASTALAFGAHLLASESAPSLSTIVLTPSQMTWSPPSAAGNDSTMLWGDRAHGQHATLSHYAAGYGIEPHYHTNDMRGLIVSGTWVLGLVAGVSHELPAGSYFFLPGKTAHTDLCKGPSPCTIFLMQENSRDLVPLTVSGQR